jgi:hypothetical protein
MDLGRTPLDHVELAGPAGAYRFHRVLATDLG